MAPKGTIVIRRPNASQSWIHPAWLGVVLALNDPRAWTGTLRFPLCTFPNGPTHEECAAWVEECGRRWGWSGSFPVFWDFGPHGSRVYWERNPDRATAEECASAGAERVRALEFETRDTAAHPFPKAA